MAIYPGATKKLLDMQYLSGKTIASYNRVNLHVQAGTGSLYGFFNHEGRASSHFWVSYSGKVEQYVDTKYRAEADLDGNDATISIETEGGTGSKADSDPWKDAQVEAIIDLVAWITKTHKIPVRLVKDAYPAADSSRGVSWHRCGIDGNFPELPDIRAGRKQRGGGGQMYYSSSTGKVCPGGGKIKQIPYIVDRINGEDTTPPKPSEPEPPETGGLEVDGQWGKATTKELQKLLGTPVDGVISHQYKQPGVNHPGLYAAQWDDSLDGSTLIRAMQEVLGVEEDGLCGKDTIKALQKRMGTPVDGVISTPESAMVKEMQRRLNTGDAAV
jgi:hypothetical protein